MGLGYSRMWKKESEKQAIQVEVFRWHGQCLPRAGMNSPSYLFVEKDTKARGSWTCPSELGLPRVNNLPSNCHVRPGWSPYLYAEIYTTHAPAGGQRLHGTYIPDFLCQVGAFHFRFSAQILDAFAH